MSIPAAPTTPLAPRTALLGQLRRDIDALAQLCVVMELLPGEIAQLRPLLSQPNPPTLIDAIIELRTRRPGRCPCGQPLHYATLADRTTAERQIFHLGPAVAMTTLDGSWLVDRHWLILHGSAEPLADAAVRLGFQPLLVCPRCGKTSANPDDLAGDYCGHCHMVVLPGR